MRFVSMIVLLSLVFTSACTQGTHRMENEPSSQPALDSRPHPSEISERQHLDPSVRKFLESAEDYELFAIYPHRPRPDETPNPEHNMHGFLILSRTTVSKSKGFEALSGIYHGLRDEFFPRANCFNPRHALRARRGDRWVDLVVCYQCQRIFAYDETGRSWEISTDPEARPALDRIYESVGLTIAGD